jgi:L-aspartate oxidase
MNQTQILILGSGLAGALSAIIAAEKGFKVTIITKTDDLLSGSSRYAQGGIIYKGDNDTPEKLKSDIMDAGAGHCWEPAVDQLCELGPKLVKELLIDRLQVDFDKDINSELDLTSEGAHSQPRIIHSKDMTGRTIQTSVIKALHQNKNIEILTNHTLVDLLTLSHHSKNSLDIYEKPACFGALVLNNVTGKVFPIFAVKTILATGGLGQIYIHTTNPAEATGDGIAAAWRAGARCFNLQYIQFHPTTFYGERERFLISESLRGEGAVLKDKDRKEFMQKYHPLGSLAPRDIVSRAIHHTLLVSKHPCVYLDISFKKSEWIRKQIPYYLSALL